MKGREATVDHCLIKEAGCMWKKENNDLHMGTSSIRTNLGWETGWEGGAGTVNGKKIGLEKKNS